MKVLMFFLIFVSLFCCPCTRDESQIHCLLDLRSDGNDKVEEGAIDMPSFDFASFGLSCDCD